MDVAVTLSGEPSCSHSCIEESIIIVVVPTLNLDGRLYIHAMSHLLALNVEVFVFPSTFYLEKCQTYIKDQMNHPKPFA